MWVDLENASHLCTSSHRCTTRNRELICIICRNNGENEARSRKRGRERAEHDVETSEETIPSYRSARGKGFYWGLWDLRWIRFSVRIITVPTTSTAQSRKNARWVRCTENFTRTFAGRMRGTQCRASIHVITIGSCCGAMFAHRYVTGEVSRCQTDVSQGERSYRDRSAFFFVFLNRHMHSIPSLGSQNCWIATTKMRVSKFKSFF